MAVARYRRKIFNYNARGGAEVAFNIEDIARQVAGWIWESSRVVIFTGAGISTESGVPDFRRPGGIWDRFDPEEMTYQNFVSKPESRRVYWELYYNCWKEFAGVEPNRAHLAVAELENRYQKLSAVITQNVDGLHQEAGNSPGRVWELHGTMWQLTCLNCSSEYSWDIVLDALENGEEVENCSGCGGLLKPATVSFGQALPSTVLLQAQQLSVEADLFISIGSSLVVYPAAMLPQLAKDGGGRLVIINREPTPLDPMADLVWEVSAGEAMSEVMEQLYQMED